MIMMMTMKIHVLAALLLFQSDPAAAQTRAQNDALIERASQHAHLHAVRD